MCKMFSFDYIKCGSIIATVKQNNIVLSLLFWYIRILHKSNH